MNEREIGELRRRLRPDKTSITHIYGCYVDEQREILSRFDQSVSILSEEEGERVLSLMKKSLSGTLGKNLVDISFSTKQVAEGEEHKLLMALRDGGTKNPELLETFYQKVTETIHLETGYVILLAEDAYDVPLKGRDDRVLDEGSETMFRYILCSICPVKLSRPALTYNISDGVFCDRSADYLVGNPELGFMFPAFDSRATNLYGALYYCRNLSENQGDFVTSVFGTQPPMPAEEQKEVFRSILGMSLEDESSLETVQAVRDQLCAMIQEHKESKEPELLTINKGTVKGLLAACGVSAERVESFDREYDQVFGADVDLQPRNVVDPKQLEVKTPDVTIRVNPERPGLVETRVIGGARYILVRAEEGVELNGVPIQIHGDEEDELS